MSSLLTLTAMRAYADDCSNSARLAADMALYGKDPTPAQRISVTSGRTGIVLALKKLRKLQRHHMPLSAVMFEDVAIPTAVETTVLYLASQIPAGRWQALVPPRLLDVEWRLHRGQAEEALDRLRSALSICAHLKNFHETQSQGQREGTRTYTQRASNQRQIDAHVATYCRARAALLELDSNRDSWQATLRELKDGDITELHLVKDIRAAPPPQKTGDKARHKGRMTEAERVAAATAPIASSARHQLSWIWFSIGAPPTFGSLDAQSLGYNDGA